MSYEWTHCPHCDCGGELSIERVIHLDDKTTLALCGLCYSIIKGYVLQDTLNIALKKAMPPSPVNMHPYRTNE